MKRNIFYIVLFSVILLGSCEKTYVETNRDAYDWNSIDAKILGFNGPSEVYASGQIPSHYSVAGRGGSTYKWDIEGATATVVKDDDNFAADITWDQVTDTTYAKLIVTETTVGGKTAADTMDITLYEFCALDNGIDDLMGSTTGTDDEDGYWYGSIGQDYVLSKVSETEFSITGLFYTKLNAWGTGTFIEGGSCNVTFNPNGPALEIPNQFYVTNDEGAPWKYYIEGSGSWSNCGAGPHIELVYDILYVDPDYPDEGPFSMWDGLEGAKPFLRALIDPGTKKVISVEVTNPNNKKTKGNLSK